jgi:hypothetical protein
MKKTPSPKTVNKEKKQKERWHRAYHAPSTRKNLSRLWILPEVDQITDDLLSFGGRVGLMLRKLTPTIEKQQTLFFQIREKIHRATVEQRKRFEHIVMLGDQAVRAENELDEDQSSDMQEYLEWRKENRLMETA